MLTNFPNGVSSFGVPMLPTAIANSPYANTWFVDSAVGSNGYSGNTPQEPFSTMARAFQSLHSGDVIYFRGNITEQLSSPVGVFDVTIIGAGNRPRHADAHTGNGGFSAATWKPPASPVAATPLLIIRQQGWRLVNFLMDGPSDAAAVRLFRDGGAGDAERDASHASFYGMKILNGSIGIEDHGGCGQHWIEGCDFFGNTTDIDNTTGAGIGQSFLYSMIKNCRFISGTTGILLPSQALTIAGCSFARGYTDKINLAGGVGDNIVGPLNVFQGTYSAAGGYTAGTNDEWAGNFTDAGVTTANPA